MLLQEECLGPHELRCNSISKNEPTGDARVDERSSIKVSSTGLGPSPIPLSRIVDTESVVTVMTFSTCNRVALQIGIALQPHRLDLYAANGKICSFYVSVVNMTSIAQNVKCGTMLGTAASVRLVCHAVAQCSREHKNESDGKSKSPNKFVNRIIEEML